ncbi:hypothetical protein D3C80_1505840 [compost metagenome]
MLFKILTASFGHQVNRNTGGIRGDQTTRFTVAFYFFKYLLFNIESFNDYFYHPVAISDALHIVIKVPRRDALCKSFAVNRRWI